MIEKRKMLYDGKAKSLYEADNDDEVIVYYKDEATAFNGVKKASIKNKGLLNNKISSIVFDYLIEQGVKTHFIKRLDEKSQLCKKVTIIPLEFICRNQVAGAMAKRLGMAEGIKLDKPILEISYKNDELNDPFINDDYATTALKVVTNEQLAYCYQQVLEINKLLEALFLKTGISLIDFKVEFGIDKQGAILLADEFSPDNCRLWEIATNRRLDKDVFRRDLDDIKDTYQLVLSKLEQLNL
ncbi:phosphoribosylaminoimidazolesuccinocarboxamide synthase [Erysipelotrichaceae bacterium OttesenSCG-928-M19]|nr:phosphoribosylaminoimidazolesuccinocarboxamide synthase [Erysipelotrichaceae bacterium OttesenSCG-928-M19]